MEPACSEVQKEEDKIEALSDDEEEASPQDDEEEEEDDDEEEEEKEEDDDDAAEEICSHNTETNLTIDSLTLLSQQGTSEPEKNLHSDGDLPLAEELNPNPNPNPTPIPNPNSHPDPTPTPIIEANKIDDDDHFLDNDRRPEIHTRSHKPNDHVAFSVAADDQIAIISPLELHTIPEICPEEEIFKEEMVMQQQESMCEKENVGGAHVRGTGATHHDQLSRRSPRLIKNLPPLLPITQQQPLKANKREQVCKKLPVNEGLKPVNEGMKPVMKMSKGNEASTTPKQRQPALPVNFRSAIKRMVSNDSNEHNLHSPSSRITEDIEDDPPQNCSRASIESSPCLRQQGCISLDDVRRFSTLHITSRSSSRLERFSLRGGKIDRVARFAQLQKIWKKDSFVRGIDGEKRRQILNHLFTPTRTTT